DSDSDEQVILVPSYPSNNIPGAEPKDTSDAHSNGVLVDTAEDIFQQDYSDADWIDIMVQVHANAGLSSELLGADVNDDNFAERMVALINQRKKAFTEQTAKEKRDRPMTPAQQREYMRVFVKNQSTPIYSTGWSMKYVKSLADEQLIAEFEKIRMAVADLKSHKLRRTLKRAGKALEPDTSKKQKSTEAPIPSVHDVPQPQVVSSSKSSGTRRKSL
ncbi:hypothetical protein Tco_1381310, partial [Tanacetum coccineum]